MVEETYAISDSFVSTALLHGLVSQAAAQQILTHAQRNSVAQSVAAFNLELMDLAEVQAVQLLQSPTSLAPGYELQGLLGTGAMGMVFRARQVALDRDVALKTIRLQQDGNNQDSARISREARSIAKLQHPNIVSAYDAGVHEGRVFIAMEMIDGEDLSSYIKRAGKLAELDAWQIARQVASALAQADAKGIVHRDIKPGNILLTRNADELDAANDALLAKVTDFGLAYSTTDDKQLQMTATGATLGTPAYVAPEQLDNTHVDACADIYSLGATIVHMLTGQPPYHDCSPIQALVAKTTGKDKWREALPDYCASASSQLLLEMTENAPEDRIDNYAELLQRIDEVIDCLQGKQPVSRPAPHTHVARVATHSRPTKLSLLAPVAGLALIAGVMLLPDRSAVPVSRSEVRPSAWKPASLPRPLFNGLSVPLFPQSGSWRSHTASDGSRVLAAAEGSQLTIPLQQTLISGPDSNWQFRVSLQPQQQGTARVLIRAEADGPSLALVVDAERAHLIALNDASEPSELATAPLPTSTDQSSFLACQFSKIGADLIVRINGERVGAISLNSATPVSVILVAEQGETYFADLDIVELLPRDEPANGFR